MYMTIDNWIHRTSISLPNILTHSSPSPSDLGGHVHRHEFISLSFQRIVSGTSPEYLLFETSPASGALENPP